MNKLVLLFGALIVIPLLVFLAMSFGKDPRSLDSPLVGRQAPNFSLRGLDGELVQLEEFRGQPVFINFWATWCQPCIAEHPVLQAAAQRYEGRVKFLGIVYHDEIEKIEAFIASRGGWGSTLLDLEGKVAVAYGVYGAPETFFINSEGVIVEKLVGTLPPEFLFRKLDNLL